MLHADLLRIIISILHIQRIIYIIEFTTKYEG